MLCKDVRVNPTSGRIDNRFHAAPLGRHRGPVGCFGRPPGILSWGIVKVDSDGQNASRSAPGQVDPGTAAWLGRGLLAGLVVAGATLLSPRLPLVPLPAYVMGFLLVGLLALLCADATRGRARLPWFLAAAAVLVAQSRLQLPAAWAAPAVTACLLWVTTGVGHAMGPRIEHAGHILFVAWISTVADVFSVFHHAGVTHAVAESKVALSVVALPFPMLGTADVVPFLGGGDVIFMALYLSVTRRHGLSVRRTWIGLGLGLLLTLVALLMFGRVVPALPFLGLGVLCLQPTMRRPPAPQRLAATAIATALSLSAAALLWVENT